MRRSLAFLSSILMLAVGACGGDGTSLFSSIPEGSSATAGPSEFEGTPGTVPPNMGTIVLQAAGETWELPVAVCLRDESDTGVVLAVAQQQAAGVRSLVGHLVSGWPTTTYALDFDYATYERDLSRAAITALALAEVLGEQDALEAALLRYEEGYGDPDEGWGPPNEISGRLAAWKVEAADLTGAVAAHCAG